MKEPVHQKSNDGIKRRRKIKKTRTETRPFVVPNTKVSISINGPETSIKKKVKKTTEGIRRPEKKIQSPVLGDYDRPGIPEITLEKSFYTTPKKTSDSSRYMLFLVSFLKHNKNTVGHIIRGIGVMVVLFIMLSQNPKAYVVIDPHIEYQKIDQIIELQKNPSETDLGFDVIAITDEESVTLVASEERLVEDRSQGEITIFNNFSTEPQRLLPETLFESASGKIYQLGTQEIFVPGKTRDGPGTINTIISAQNSGEEYNIDITDFTIPGFKEAGLNAKYNGVYAVSTSSFEGGFIGNKLFISEEQRENAKVELQQKLRERLVLRLEKEKTDQVILINNSLSIQYKELDSSLDTNGLISQGGTILSLVISKEKLFEYLTQNNMEVPEGEIAQVIDIHNLKTSLISSDPGNNFNYENAKNAKVVLTGDILIAWKIDKDILAFDLVGKDKKDLLNFFMSKNSIDRAVVTTRPFWRNILPKNETSIIITENKIDQV